MDLRRDGSSEREQRHTHIKYALIVIGGIFMAAGITLTVIGFIDFVKATGNFGMPKRFWFLIVGIPLFATGLILLLFGVKREISRYVKNETIPIFNETGRQIAPALQNMAAAIQAGMANVQEEMTADVQEGMVDLGMLCECGERNAMDSKFCRKCGRSLRNTCPECGADLPADSKFCNHCGKQL